MHDNVFRYSYVGETLGIEKPLYWDQVHLDNPKLRRFPTLDLRAR